MWALIDQNIYGVSATAAESRLGLSVQRLRHELFAWYKQHRQHRVLHELTDLTPAMLGTSTQPQLATKAAETSTLVEFYTELMGRYGGQLGQQGEALEELGKCLLELRRHYHECPRCISLGQANALVAAGQRAAMLREVAGVPFTPKWQLMQHLACDSYWRGNPQSYATFMDENMNGFFWQGF